MHHEGAGRCYSSAVARPRILLIGRANIPDSYVPAHYVKQFHMDFTTDKAALDAKVKASGQASWDLYWINVISRFDQNPDLPWLGPWKAKEALGKEIQASLGNRGPDCKNRKNNCDRRGVARSTPQRCPDQRQNCKKAERARILGARQ